MILLLGYCESQRNATRAKRKRNVVMELATWRAGRMVERMRYSRVAFLGASVGSSDDCVEVVPKEEMVVPDVFSAGGKSRSFSGDEGIAR